MGTTDANTDWDVQADGTLEERFYYCQNWRHDVVALLDANGAGQQVEQVRYEAYGMPYVVVAGDVDVSGKIDSADTTQIQSWIDTSTYDVLGDVDLDGDVDSTDKSIVSSDPAGGGNRGELTHGVHANRKGYAGYEFDDTITHESYHVRHRVLNSELGQWTRRDPLGYVDSANLMSYLMTSPVNRTDPSGLAGCGGVSCISALIECRPKVITTIEFGTCSNAHRLSAKSDAQALACSEQFGREDENCADLGMLVKESRCDQFAGGDVTCILSCDSCEDPCTCCGRHLVRNDIRPPIYGVSICFQPSDCCITVWLRVEMTLWTQANGQCQEPQPEPPL